MKTKGNKKEYLEITLTPIKIPKNRILRWLYWNVYWRIWEIGRPLLIGKIYYLLGKILKVINKKLERYLNKSKT